MLIMVTYYQPPCPSCETEIFLLSCVLFPLKYLSMLHLSGKCKDSGKKDGCQKQSPELEFLKNLRGLGTE